MVADAAAVADLAAVSNSVDEASEESSSSLKEGYFFWQVVANEADIAEDSAVIEGD